jgi:head-tail adaptor
MRLAVGPRRFAIRAVAEPDARGRDRVCQVEELPRESRS